MNDAAACLTTVVQYKLPTGPSPLASSQQLDDALHRCEDCEVYLRLTRQFRIASYPDIVAEHRKYGSNVSSDHLDMLQRVAESGTKGASSPRDTETRRAWRSGRSSWRAYYAEQIPDAKSQGGAQDRLGVRLMALARAGRASPGAELVVQDAGYPVKWVSTTVRRRRRFGWGEGGASEPTLEFGLAAWKFGQISHHLICLTGRTRADPSTSDRCGDPFPVIVAVHARKQLPGGTGL